MKAYHICYHTDEDGLATAAVIYEYLKRVNKEDKKRTLYFFYKIDYTMDLKEVLPDDIPSGDEIYFVDYSFSNMNNLKYVLELSNKDINIIWIDHHKTSQDIIDNYFNSTCQVLNMYPNFHYFINTEYCGAYLAYFYAYIKINYNIAIEKIKPHLSILDDDLNIPLYIKYVDSWDTWKHNMPNTTEFNIGIRSIRRTPKNALSFMLDYKSNLINKLFSNDDNDFKEIEKYMQTNINKIINTGKTIKLYQDIENESICNEYGFKFDIIEYVSLYESHTYHCFAVNKRGNSTMFGDKINEYDIVVPFQFNGSKYVYSLYTNKEYVDCEDLAKKLGNYNKLGGGGHKQAAGFQTYNQLIEANCIININKKIFTNNNYKIYKISRNK